MHLGPLKTHSEKLKELQNQSFLSKYKKIVLAICIFITLGVGVLIFDYYTSVKIQYNSQLSRLVDRQKIISQKIVKQLFIIQEQYNQSRSLEKSLHDLNKNYLLFDDTLRAFKVGSSALDDSGTPIVVHRIITDKGLSALEKTLALWEPFKEALKPLLLSTGELSSESLSTAILYANEHNEALFVEMNNLASEIERNTSQRIHLMRIIQGIVFGMMIFNFIYILYEFITKIKTNDRTLLSITEDLEKSNQELLQANHHILGAQAEVELMFSSIKQGLFLINSEYKIGAQYTSELKSMFQIEDLEGMSFIGILQRLLPDKMYRISRDYVEMLFDPTKKEKALITVNPLDQIEVNFSDPKGGFVTKYFEFTFRRIINSDRSIPRVFVAVRDTTKQAQLTRQLHDSEKKKERQFELLFAILHIDHDELETFTTSTRKSLEEMNQELKAEDFVGVTLGIAQDAMLRQRLHSLFRKIHTIKGAAGSIDLEFFVTLCHEIENKIEKLQNTSKLSGEDFLGIVLQKAEMKSAIDELEELYKKLTEMKNITPFKRIDSLSDPLQLELEKLTRTLQSQTGKNVRIEFNEFNQKTVPQKHLRSIHDVMIQLIRNSFAHGIESYEERIRQQKDPIATLHLSGSLTDLPGYARFTFRDDGHGFDIQRIRSKCIEKKLITPEESIPLSDEAILPYIFLPGFSTQMTTDSLSGRGVGLDIVSHAVITTMQGELFVNYKKDEFCEFIMEIPL